MSLTRYAIPTAIAVATGFAIAVTGGGAPSVSAQQMPPAARVFGSITFNGTSGPSGAVVTAYSGATLCGTAAGNGLYGAGTPNQYFVDIDSSISACAAAGTTITFKINGQAANETTQVPAIGGSAVSLNLTGPAAGTTPAAGTATATYAPGWNIVGGPAGTTFAQALNPLYTFPANNPSAPNYQTVPNTQTLTPGQGYWAYFNSTTTVNLSGTATLLFSISIPAAQYIQIANPTTTNVTVSGADIVYAYDPTVAASGQPYTAITTLKPGQGAWAYSNAGGTLTLR